MPAKTDLNVTPYFDDFDADNNFHQVLARPGHSIQARELTQLQSILKNQVERISDFVLQEGTMVIPGQLKIMTDFDYLKIENAYGGETINVSQYVGATITGQSSKVSAVVVHVETSTATDQSTFYLRYTGAGTDKTGDAASSPVLFTAGETLSASIAVTNGSTAYGANDVSAQVYTDSTGAAPTGKGVGATMTPGTYYLRGSFVEVAEQTITLGKYSIEDVNVRVGFTITETIVTPEADSTLLDNATGTSNYAAKGAHRLKIAATLSYLDSGATADTNFIQLLEVKAGKPTSVPNRAQLGTIIDTLARRTYDESGDYTVRPFTFEVKECVTLNENEGVFTVGEDTDEGNTASTDLLALKVSPGKAYIRGFEIEKIRNTFVDIPKARDFNSVNSGVTNYDVGNFLQISNVYGMPDISFISGETTPYKQISLMDTFTATRGSSSGARIGIARARTVEYVSGTAGLPEAVYKLYLWDFRPFTIITLSGTPSPTLEANHGNGGVQVKGDTSGATGWVFADGTSGTDLILTNVSGSFKAGEKFSASDSSESDLLVENSSNVDLTIETVVSKKIGDAKQVHMTDADSGQHFTADIVLTPVSSTDSFILLEGTDSAGANAGDNLLGELEGIPVGLERAATGGTG